MSACELGIGSDRAEVPVCPECGSENVAADAAARWSVESQEWEVSNIFDKGHGCDDCGAQDFEFAWAIKSSTTEVSQTVAKAIPEIHLILVASTGHITVQEARMLDACGYSRGEYGWFFHVGTPGDDPLTELEPFSDGLSGLIKKARALGCAYVLLDRDGEEVAGIPTYPWT